MQTVETARESTLDVLTGFTHIDTIISGATAQGKYYVNIDKSVMTQGIIDELKTNGFKVLINYSEGNPNFPLYTIDWTPDPIIPR